MMDDFTARSSCTECKGKLTMQQDVICSGCVDLQREAIVQVCVCGQRYGRVFPRQPRFHCGCGARPNNTVTFVIPGVPELSDCQFQFPASLQSLLSGFMNAIPLHVLFGFSLLPEAWLDFCRTFWHCQEFVIPDTFDKTKTMMENLGALPAETTLQSLFGRWLPGFWQQPISIAQLVEPAGTIRPGMFCFELFELSLVVPEGNPVLLSDTHFGHWNIFLVPQVSEHLDALKLQVSLRNAVAIGVSLPEPTKSFSSSIWNTDILNAQGHLDLLSLKPKQQHRLTAIEMTLEQARAAFAQVCPAEWPKGVQFWPWLPSMSKTLPIVGRFQTAENTLSYVVFKSEHLYLVDVNSFVDLIVYGNKRQSVLGEKWDDKIAQITLWIEEFRDAHLGSIFLNGPVEKRDDGLFWVRDPAYSLLGEQGCTWPQLAPATQETLRKRAFAAKGPALAAKGPKTKTFKPIDPKPADWLQWMNMPDGTVIGQPVTAKNALQLVATTFAKVSAPEFLPKIPKEDDSPLYGRLCHAATSTLRYIFYSKQKQLILCSVKKLEELADQIPAHAWICDFDTAHGDKIQVEYTLVDNTPDWADDDLLVYSALYGFESYAGRESFANPELYDVALAQRKRVAKKPKKVAPTKRPLPIDKVDKLVDEVYEEEKETPLPFASVLDTLLPVLRSEDSVQAAKEAGIRFVNTKRNLEVQGKIVWRNVPDWLETMVADESQRLALNSQRGVYCLIAWLRNTGWKNIRQSIENRHARWAAEIWPVSQEEEEEEVPKKRQREEEEEEQAEPEQLKVVRITQEDFDIVDL